MKKVLLLGYGNSNKELYKLINNQYETYIYDDSKEVDYNLEKIKKELPTFDIVVRSPGISSNSEIYNLMKMLSKEVISEIEFSLRLIKSKLVKYIVVTGTNGKTTIATYLYRVLSTYFDNVFLCGNIGVPLSSIVNKIEDNSILIIEMSSFQIEDTYLKFADYIIVSNIEPNHLDEVRNFTFYKSSKKRVGLLKKDEGILVVEEKEENTFKEFNPLVIKKEDGEGYLFLNIHFIYLICYMFNISRTEVKKILENNYRVPYRNELLNLSYKASIINDSKSTSVASSNTCLSLHKNKKRIVILGGISKSDSFKNLMIKDDDIILIYGRDKEKIFNELEKGIMFDTLNQIVEYIKQYLNDDIYILFTPGCSSFDQFNNYIERGETFKRLIGECHD